MNELKIVVADKSEDKYDEILSLYNKKFEVELIGKSSDSFSIPLEKLELNDRDYRRRDDFFDELKEEESIKLYLDNQEIKKSDLDGILGIVNCNTCYEKCPQKKKYCYEGEGWGCRLLDSIKLTSEVSENSFVPRLLQSNDEMEIAWYNFGQLEHSVWKIDSKQIEETLKKEIENKYITQCQHFNFDNIKKTIDNLEKKIDMVENEFWEYTYHKPPYGMKKTKEIVGIKPKEGRWHCLAIEEYEEHENEKNKNIPKVSFQDIGGIDKIVRQVREVIELPIIAPDVFKHYNIKPHKGILLYGPPGCGKTMIAKAIANEINAHFIVVNGPEIFDKFFGESEAKIRRIFKEAKKFSPSIIYFDEFDSIAAIREGRHAQTPVVNQLLTSLDGLESNENIRVIASTNRIDMIDEAIKRPGRFDYTIEIEKPDLAACRKIFRIHTDNMPLSPEFSKKRFVEKYLKNLTGAEIAFIATEAAYNAFRRTIDFKKILSNSDEIVIDEKNVVLEMDFIKAYQKLNENKIKSESAKYRYL
jgi:SpoVK/Ycf46/Vps4 family AAA+-type ATPase